MNFHLKSIISYLLCFTIILCNLSLPADASPSNQDKFNGNEKRIVLPNVFIQGGSYKNILKQKYDHRKYEVHHLITRFALNAISLFCRMLAGKGSHNDFIFSKEQAWAPSILLTPEDHARIPSSIGDTNLRYNRNQAQRILLNGEFEELIEEELQFIEQNLNTDHRYDIAIRQVRNYVRELNIRIVGSSIILNINGKTKYISIFPKKTSDDLNLMFHK